MTDSSNAAKTTLLIDWGGVLTPPLSTLWDSWGESRGIQADHFRRVLTAWHDLPSNGHGFSDSPSARFERGEISEDAFEHELAAALTALGSQVESDGLLAGALSGLSEHNMAMYTFLNQLKAQGVTIGLLSNSWGDCYERTHWDVFEDTVCSGEVGMRKPESRIFRLAAARLDARLEEIIFVDDLASNITAAEALGIQGVLHKNNQDTISEVTKLLNETPDAIETSEATDDH